MTGACTNRYTRKEISVHSIAIHVHKGQYVFGRWRYLPPPTPMGPPATTTPLETPQIIPLSGNCSAPRAWKSFSRNTSQPPPPPSHLLDGILRPPEKIRVCLRHHILVICNLIRNRHFLHYLSPTKREFAQVPRAFQRISCSCLLDQPTLYQTTTPPAQIPPLA